MYKYKDSKLEEALQYLNNASKIIGYFDNLLNREFLVNERDDFDTFGNILKKIKSVHKLIISRESKIKTYRNLNNEANKKVGYLLNNVPDSDSVNISSSSSGGYYSGDYSSGSSSSSTSSKASDSVSISNDKSKTKNKDSESKEKVGKIDVDALIIDFLAPFGVTKENYGGISKSEKGGYVVTLKNNNKDGKWNDTDIKEYYIENGKIVGVVTGDGKYIKVEDGKLVIDETNKNIYTSIMSVGVGAAGSFFATKSNYNTDTNREIFKKFYPNATDEEFNNFCDNISKSGEEYSDAAKKIIEANKDSISDLAKKTGYDFLTIEDNAIKIDYNGMATELYAYESSKTGINFADGISNEITFNESMVTDIAEYMKSNYSIDIDVNSIFQGVADSNNIASDSTSVE